ncbi:MAG: glycosyltransferase family 1 protein [Chlamydiales bacterium]
MAFSSGIGTYIREIVPYFLGSPFRTVLLVDQPGSPWCKEFDQIAFKAPVYSIREQLLYPLKIPSVDLFWSPHYNVPLLPIRAAKRIVTIHDVCHLALGSGLQKFYAKSVMGFALRRSDKAITVSQFSKREIEKYLGLGPLEMIPIGVNAARFSAQSGSDWDLVRKKYRLPDRFVLFVGNNKPHKNLKRLARAFTQVNIPGLELVMAGQGTPTGPVEERDLPVLYRMAEAFVFPSLYEGFGLPPLEAMASGCPTAVSRAASMPEVCGDGSLYFDPTNEEEMARAIREAVGNLPLVERGFARVKQLNWEKTAASHIQVFEEVCCA